MATTYLSDTQATPTNNKKWTWSSWCKFSGTGEQYIMSAYTDANNATSIRFLDATNRLDFQNYVSSSDAGRLKTTRNLRDPSAWYHIVCVFDSDNVTSGDRQQIWINGVRETAFDTETYPSSGAASILNASGIVAEVGRRSDSANMLNGELAHTHFCDGQAYSASDFGETDATSGIWIPKSGPSVTYGTNGFFLKYESGASGTDSSGNSNDFTVSGTMTNLKDTPDNNFATMNPLLKSSYCTLSNGNTKTFGNAGADTGNCSTTLLATTGLYYAEIKSGTIYGTTYPRVGVQHTPNTNYGRCVNGTDGGAGGQGTPNNNEGYACANGQKFTSNALSSFASAWVATDILAVAMDCTNGAAYVAINNVWQNSGDPTSGASKTGALVTWTPSDVDATAFASCDYNGSFLEWNFGNGYFGSTVIGSAVSSGNGLWKYSPPTNYVSLNTKEINS